MKKIIIAILALCGFVVSCNFLDVVPEKLGTIEYVYRERNSAETALATCYSYMPYHGHHTNDPGRTMGPEVTTYNLDKENGIKVTLYGNSKSSPYLDYWNGSNGGKDLYRALRDCNDFLENVHLVRDLNAAEKERWIAEVKVLKAYYHWMLIQHYGPIVLVKENLPISASPEEARQYRTPVNECIDYVVSLLDEAIYGNAEDPELGNEPPLPLYIDELITEYGRITRPIAMALKAKILTFAASPFYNGNTMYKNFVDNRGVYLWPSEYDANKWVKAAQACKEAIDICHEAGIRLYELDENTFIPPISDETRRIVQTSSIVSQIMNCEHIWDLTTFDSKNVQFYVMPALDAEFRRVMVRSRLGPTMSTVERFYSSNGVPIDEDTQWEENGWYKNRYFTDVAGEGSRLEIEPGMTVSRLDMNREPRYYGSIAFNGGKWYGGGYPVPEKSNSEDYQYTVKCLAGNTQTSPAGRVGQSYYSVTGYFSKKLTNYKTCIPSTGGSFTEEKYFWPIIRLADLYLLYAEALNETKDAPDEEVWQWVNLIRQRAGLQDVATSWSNHSKYPDKYKTKSGMRDIIHQERCIELALEGHYYYDIRRWSGGSLSPKYDILVEMNKPIQGWNSEGTDNESFYQLKTIYAPTFTLRDYLWPIKESNMDVNPNLVQNPGY